MKTGETIRDLLGFTQQEMALVLNISRGHWSMYESGKRDLPLAAMQLLAELLMHIKSPDNDAKSPPHVVKQQEKRQQHLERLLRENEYKQVLLAKTIAGIEKKYTAKVRVLQLVDFLHSRNAGKGGGDTHVLKSIGNSAKKVVESPEVTSLVEHQIRYELLELEKILLHSKLRKMGITY